MKRSIGLMLTALLVAAAFSLVFAGPGLNGPRSAAPQTFDYLDNLSDPSSEVIQSVSAAVDEINTSLGGSYRGGRSDSGCVQVSLEMPDSIQIQQHHGAVQGMFHLVNCDDAAAQVTLTFQVTISVPGMLDTTLTFRQCTVPMEAGQTIDHPFRFMVPPFSGVYTFCATATSGSFVATGCATTVVSATPFNGFPIRACGVLVQGTDCVFFAPRGCGMHPRGFMLENYGTFVAGDTVCIEGFLFPDCQTPCPEAHGCVMNNTITTPTTNPGGPFEGCGTLVQGTDCVLFEVLGHADRKFALQNYGTFVVGDSVCVHGMLDPNCQLPCPEATGCVINNQIQPMGGGPGPGTMYEGCGLLTQGTNCLVFVAVNDANVRLVLENYGPFGLYDTVCVRGMLEPNCPNMCPEAVGCLVRNDIHGSTPPNPQFQGCGFLVQGYGCVLFKPLGMGGMQGPKFTLENYGTFVVGDSVCVQGAMPVMCPGMCPEAAGCILGNTITGGGNPPMMVVPTFSAQNYPNPFNPTTTISFALPQMGQVTVSVFNSVGQVVRVLNNGVLSAGSHEMVWDGTDNLGHQVSSGVYFYRISAAGLSETKKMLLMK
jgi:hypothetical protein